MGKHGREWTLWYALEAVEGTPKANTQYKALAHHSTLDWGDSPGPNPVPLPGSPDYSGFGKGVSNPVVRATFNPSGANGAQFIEDFASSDSSFTLIAKTGSVFQVFAGCKVKNINPQCSKYPNHTVLEVTAEIWAHAMTDTEPATVTYESIPTSHVNYTDCVVKLDAGAAATTTLLDWHAFSFTIDNTLHREPKNDGTTDKITRGTRDAKIQITRPVDTSTKTEMDASKNATAYSASVAFAASLFTFTSGVFEDVAVSVPRADITNKRITLFAARLAIA